MHRDPNVTPLIDVMLVLVIVFMLSAPPTGIDVTLPREDDEGEVIQEPIVLAVDAEGEVAINGHPIDGERLPGLLRDIFESRADKALMVRADGGLRYGQVVDVLDVARGSGVERVGLWGDEPYQPLRR